MSCAGRVPWDLGNEWPPHLWAAVPECIGELHKMFLGLAPHERIKRELRAGIRRPPTASPDISDEVPHKAEFV